MEIITNGHERELVCFFELPESVRADFDYVDAEEQCSPRFFRYRGCWYDVNEFMAVNADRHAPDSFASLAGWDGYQADTHFSAVLIRWGADCDSVVPALALS